MILATALAVAASTGVAVDVGKWNPANFPSLIKLERRLPHADMTRRVEGMFEKGTCRIQGQSKRRFDVTIPYAVLMENSGTLKKVVVGEIGCASLETLVGQVVVAQAGRGDFKAEHGSGEQWYTSELNFAMGEPLSALPEGEKDKVICKAGEPMLGSRVKRVRLCKTAAEWQAFNADRQQLRRDIQNTSRDATIEQ